MINRPSHLQDAQDLTLWLRRYSRLRVSHLMTSVIRLVKQEP
jgi:hypothetical protein